MSSNIPSNPIAPGEYVETATAVSAGVSVPGGTRVAVFIGEGARTEILVASALGSGSDGLNSTYTGTTGREGRHFALQLFPIVSNRLQLFKNGVLLQGTQQIPDNSAFSNKYDYRVDIATGHIELQTAALVDLGGSFYTSGLTNVGVGNLDGYGGPALVDLNAPTETWTVKCISARRDSSSNVLDQSAKFLAFGSVSGSQVDSNGNPVVWLANGQQVSNGIIEFAINETQVSNVSTSPFREGDFFTIRVKSGALNRNDSLTASYISTADLNDPEIFDAMQPLAAKHGAASLTNTLSLGAQLAFANSPPAIMALQAAPAMPRRTSLNLVDQMHAASTSVDDFVIPLPPGVVPNVDSNIHFFVTDPATKIEQQLLANKHDFYTLDTSGNPSTSDFVFSDTPAPAGYDFFYSVIESAAAETFGADGYLNRSSVSSVLGTFSVAGTTFDSSYLNKTVRLFDSDNQANNGNFVVIGVSGGKLSIEAVGITPFSPFVNRTNVAFHAIDPTTGTTVASSTAADGILVAIPSSSNANFSSTVVDFTALPSLIGLKLVITGSTPATNNGTFDIVSVDGTDTLTIAKSFVSEDALEYEIIDLDSTSSFVVLNHNIVPDGNALRISMIDDRDASFYDPGWINALEVLEASEVDIVVPLPRQTISVIFQNALNHCLAQSNIRNKHERVLFTGAIQGLTADNVLGNKPAAVEDIGVLEGIQGDNIAEVLVGNTEDLTNYSVPDSFGHTYRCIYFYPDQIVVQVGTDNQKIDGFYMAAAAAGYVSAQANISIPLTNKVLSGFTILRDRLLKPTVIDSLMSAGIAVIQPVAGGGEVRWGLTTTDSGFVEEQELSIVFIRDRIAKSFRAGVKGFVGGVVDDDTVSVVTTRVLAILKGFASARLITDYDSVTVKIDVSNPTQIDITARVSPLYPFNYVYVRVNVGQA